MAGALTGAATGSGRPRPRGPAGPDRPGGPARVLLLHGLGGRPSVWDRFAGPLTEAAAGRLELWDVELPWLAMADAGWSHRADPVDLLAEAVDERFDVLVAHSFSACLLVEAFARGRIRPRPTVLMNPFHRPDPDDFDWRTISYCLNEFHRTFAEALEVGDTGRFSRAHRDWLAAKLRDQVGPYGWMRFFETYLRSPFLDLDAVRAPVLVVSGERDIAAPAEDGRLLADRLPDGRYHLVEGGRHFPMVEQPDRIARSVADFLHDTDVLLTP
ncbi:alpha/beta fold hydrolase [Kitasatospora xanthocidica]|uniref:alpha/beta fold hydrolase n=1 Tax=Kitasatospora xanthocidica TaxID=83382 RepID=UPI0036EED8C2